MKASADAVIKPSVCPLDCPDTCSLAVEVEQDKVVAVRGSRANPYTAGVICDKVARHYPEFVHGKARLREPLRRLGPPGSDEFEAISWDEALDRVHDGLSRSIAQYGPQSVLPLNYAGPHGQLAGGSMDRRFFHQLGASFLNRGPLCGLVRGTAYASLFGQSPGTAPELAADADLIAVWGNNVTVSNLHFARVIKAAREHGAKIVVVDPKRTRVAEQADLFVQIRPGTDLPLAYALAAEFERRHAIDQAFVDQWVLGAELFLEQARLWSVERACQVCAISTEQFEQLADLYVNAERLTVSPGNGIERSHNGGGGLRAIMSLNALLGQFGRPGTGVIAKAGASFPTTGDKLQRPDLAPAGTRTINIVDVGRLLLDESLNPRIAAVFIYNHNPVCTHPDQNRLRRGLARPDVFVVGCDIVMTDSMRYADVVLPASSHFECDDLYTAYGQNYLQRAQPVIAPVGQSLPNTEIFRRLAARFGFDDDAFLASDNQLMDDAIDQRDARVAGHRGSQLPLDQAIVMTAADGAPMLMCESVTPATPSGRIELYSQSMQDAWGHGVPHYEPMISSLPLNLISPSSSKRTNATFGSDPACAAPEHIELHPQDAQARGITEGDAVRVFNDLGQTELIARVNDSVRPGVVYSPKGTWLVTSSNGQTINALVDADRRTDIADGVCFNDTFVDVALAAS